MGLKTRLIIYTCTLYMHCISSKSHSGEILFQGPIWCRDNLRVARFRGQRLQGSIRTRVHCFNNKPICIHLYCCRPFTMWQDFEGGVYWVELAEICGEISRVAGFRGVVRFRGNMVHYIHTYIYILQDPSQTFLQMPRLPQTSADSAVLLACSRVMQGPVA